MTNIPVALRLKRIDALIVNRTKVLNGWQSYRLSSGLATLGGFFASQLIQGYRLELVALFILLPIYSYFFIGSRRERRFIDKLKSLRAFYFQQGALDGAEPLPTQQPDRFPNPDLCRDLDLHELFAYIDTTVSRQGEWELKSWLCGEDHPYKIEDCHTALKNLARFPGPLRRLQILYPDQKIDLDQIKQSANLPFTERPPVWRWVLLILFVVTILLIPFGNMTMLKFNWLAYILLTLIYLQHTGSGFSRAQDLLIELEKLAPIFKELSHWRHIELSFAPKLTSTDPSKTLGTFRRYVSLMSLRANPILFYLINFIVPWTLIIIELGERSRKNLAGKIKSWNDELIAFDCFSSLANIYIYHSKTLPEVKPENSLSFTGIRHPLIPEPIAITNNFGPEDSRIFLITGSNMSGKSTFLRAMGINYCLAHMGAPVFAKTFQCPHRPIMTCIRVSDSLRDGRSYFYSEVKRLKTILERAQQESVFFLIDEPLKGTNNKERLAGNQAYLKRLLASESFGFIATHDLELTKLEEHIQGLKNFHFTEVWRDNDLYFDYTIKAGPSESTNALKIMEKEGLLSLT